MSVKVRVFLNAKSGGGCDETEIRALFEKHGCPCAITRLRKDLDCKALNDSLETAWVAAGGDGTVNFVASHCARTKRRMGVLPVGTLNHFAHDLGLPLALEPAIETIAQAYTRLVDAAEVNGEIFVNNSSLGAYPEMVVERERMKKSGRNKWASLVAASFRAFVRFRRLTVTFQLAGETHTCVTPFVFVGNNEYCLEGKALGSRKRLDEGKLSLYLAPGATRATMLRFFAAAVAGRLKQMPDFAEFQPTEFQVTTRRRHRRVSLDGEVRHLTPPMKYKILPAALNVLCTQPKMGGEPSNAHA